MWLLLCGKPKLMYQEGLLATIWKAATYDSPSEALTMTYGVLNAQGHVQVLGGNNGKCQGSNASIAFPYNEMYLANDGSLGLLRLEHMEGHQGQRGNMITMHLHVLCNGNAKKLTLLFTLAVATTHCLMWRKTLKYNVDFQ